MIDCDVFVAGGGIAGLTLAAACDAAGLSVVLADPGARGCDKRSTAYLLPARQLFEDIGLWPTLAPHATPLEALRVIDTKGWPPEVVEARTFDPADLDAACFGWNIPNDVAREALTEKVAASSRVTRLDGLGFRSALTRTDEVRITLTDGSRVRSRLLVGADGRDSAVRASAKIDTICNRYGQKALAFHAVHAAPHHKISTEIYNQGGAFTTVPLPDHDGQPCSAIVWMNDGARAQDLAAMTDDAFNAEMTLRSCGQLGQMHRIGETNIWPVITQRAKALTAERAILIAEAAHVLPPIGAQGLNTSLHDVRALYDLMRRGEAELGSAKQLDAYNRDRAADTALRARAIDVFNRVCQSAQPAVQRLRAEGLRRLHNATPLRRAVMRAGMGQRR